MRHASARNVIEQMFGIIKQHFKILYLPPGYDMSIQVLILPALAALHNFIRKYDPNEIEMYDDNETLEVGLEIGACPRSMGELGIGSVMWEETVRANER